MCKCIDIHIHNTSIKLIPLSEIILYHLNEEVYIVHHRIYLYNFYLYIFCYLPLSFIVYLHKYLFCVSFYKENLCQPYIIEYRCLIHSLFGNSNILFYSCSLSNPKLVKYERILELDIKIRFRVAEFFYILDFF